MKLLIIRHGDPDYEHDSLTENGFAEAELLAKRIAPMKPKDIYCSVLGRAKATAEPTLKALGMKAEYCEWLREFNYAKINLPYLRDKIPWDILPSFIEKHPKVFEKDGWRECDFIKSSDLAECYNDVCREFDRVLESHGYKREGSTYKVTDSNHDVLAFFCHYGLGSVLISHLFNCSPYVLWQQTVLLPTSVTEFVTEEREEGIASMRCRYLGDISHLYKFGREPSFSGRFCECFNDADRH